MMTRENQDKGSYQSARADITNSRDWELKQQEFISSQFWRPEVQGQVVNSMGVW